MKRFTWNKPSDLLLTDKKEKYITLSNHCMVRKQTPKEWHEKIDNVMLSNEFKINKEDKCVYIKKKT